MKSNHNFRVQVINNSLQKQRVRRNSSTIDKFDRSAAMETGEAVGSCRPISQQAAASRQQAAGGIAEAVNQAINNRYNRVAVILDSLQNYLISQDGKEIGQILYEGFAEWVTPLGYFLLTEGELSSVGKIKTLSATVPAPAKNPYNTDGTLAAGCRETTGRNPGVWCGSANEPAGIKATHWGKTSVVEGTGNMVGKKVANSFAAWLSWLKYLYNHDDVNGHEEIVKKYSSCEKILKYTTSGRKKIVSNSRVLAAVNGLTAAQIEALPASLRAALGI